MADSKTLDGRVLDRLFETVTSRKGGDQDNSYTAKLFARGRKKIAQKLGEEAVEAIVAALAETPEDLVNESADVLYHLLALWASCGVAPEQVWAELDSRRRQSGVEEKKSRSAG